MAEVTSFSDEPEELTWEEVENSFDTWIDDIDPDIKEGPGATGYSYSQMLKAFKAGYKLMKYGAATWEDEDEEKEPNDEDSKFTELVTDQKLETALESLRQLLRFDGSNVFLSGSN